MLLLSIIAFTAAKAACPTGDCGCSWANSGTCVTDPGPNDICWHKCCCDALGEDVYRSKVGGNDGGNGGGNGGNNNGGGQNGGNGEWEGVAKSTRYWDCCKLSCAWKGKADLAPGFTPARTCLIDGTPAHPDAVNACGGGGDFNQPGPSYSCTDTQPWTENDVMYGFAAGGLGDADCCTCYELEFLDYSIGASTYQGQLNGKRMVVQVTNTGADLGQAHFDLMIPGGGFGIYNACTGDEVAEPQFGNGQESAWGQRYGGVTNASQCDNLPESLRAGCKWRFNDFLNSDNPAVKYRQVRCPEALVQVSGCRRANESNRDPEVSNPAPTPDTTPAPTTEECPEIPIGKAKGKKTVVDTTFALTACDCWKHCKDIGAGAGEFLAKKSRCRCFDKLVKTS